MNLVLVQKSHRKRIQTLTPNSGANRNRNAKEAQAVPLDQDSVTVINLMLNNLSGKSNKTLLMLNKISIAIQDGYTLITTSFSCTFKG